MFRWFESLIDPFVERAVTEPPRSVLGFFGHFLRAGKGVVAAVFASALIVSVIEISLFAFLGEIVDRATNATSPTQFFNDNTTALIAMGVVILLVRPIAVLFNIGLVRLSLGPSLVALVSWQNYRYVLRQSIGFFQNDFAGRISQKILQTGRAVRDTVLGLVEGVWTLAVYLVGTFLLFSGLSPWLIVPVAIWATAYLLTTLRLVPMVRDRSQALAEAGSTLSGRIVDSYTNIHAVKLFAHPDREDAFVLEAFREQRARILALNRTIATMIVSLTLLNGLLISSAGGLSIWLWSAGQITIGDVALATALVLRLNQMSGWIMRTIIGLFEDVGTVENGIKTISKPLTVIDRATAKPLIVNSGEIRFDNVSFNYGPGAPVISGLSLTVRPSERVGLVGRSGAGKSTLANLLLRFFDLDEGRILIDGQDIAAVTQDSLRGAIGVVSQDPSLLHRSVRDNIRYGRPDADEEAVLDAARRSQAHAFISELKDLNGRAGYDAHVGERGVTLSGGQRQRVAIARLVLKDAPILVLDEATSALDSEVEAAIQEQLFDLMAEKTVIAIAHRLSTIAMLDRLVILDEGRIVEIGSHDELLARGGIYASLWQRQSGGFLGAEQPGTGVTQGRPLPL